MMRVVGSDAAGEDKLLKHVGAPYHEQRPTDLSELVVVVDAYGAARFPPYSEAWRRRKTAFPHGVAGLVEQSPT